MNTIAKPHVKRLTVPLIAESQLYLTSLQGSCDYQFLLSFFSPFTGNRTQVYCFSSRRSVPSTTDRLKIIYSAQFVLAIVVCYVINSLEFELMLPVM